MPPFEFSGSSIYVTVEDAQGGDRKFGILVTDRWTDHRGRKLKQLSSTLYEVQTVYTDSRGLKTKVKYRTINDTPKDNYLDNLLEIHRISNLDTIDPDSPNDVIKAVRYRERDQAHREIQVILSQTQDEGNKRSAAWVSHVVDKLDKGDMPLQNRWGWTKRRAVLWKAPGGPDDVNAHDESDHPPSDIPAPRRRHKAKPSQIVEELLPAVPDPPNAMPLYNDNKLDNLPFRGPTPPRQGKQSSEDRKAERIASWLENIPAEPQP